MARLKGNEMTLINLDNTLSTFGDIKSVKITNKVNGSRYLDIDAARDPATLNSSVLSVVDADTKARDIRACIEIIDGLLNLNTGERAMSLYRLQAIVNGSHFHQARIHVSVEFAVSTTGHGDIDNAHRNVLLVCSMSESGKAE